MAEELILGDAFLNYISIMSLCDVFLSWNNAQTVGSSEIRSLKSAFSSPPPGRHRAPNQRCRYGVYIKARSTPLINKVFGQLNILISEKKHLAHSCKFDF